MSPRQPKANAAPKLHPHHVIHRAQSAGVREAIISFSGGKDAIVTLDLCSKAFSRVEAYFLYLVPELSWEEESLRWAERHYGIKIRRLPHPSLTALMRESTFRHGTTAGTKCPRLTQAHLDTYVRKEFGIQWIATGERCRDSLERQAYIKECGGIDRLDDQEQRDRDALFIQTHGRAKKDKKPRHRFYPVGFWREQDVLSYLTRHRLPVPKMYHFSDDAFFKQRGEKKRDFGGFQMDTVAFVKERLPADYARMLRVFPLLEAQCVRWEMLKREVAGGV